MSLFPTFLNENADEVARKLLGCLLVRDFKGDETIVRIVETEAYDQEDAASHSCRGETPRTKIMFGNSGYLYVYFTYGMHYCCNIVTGAAGHGAAVLIRAVEPIENKELLAINRPNVSGVSITNGPAKLCQALGISTAMNGHNLRRSPLTLVSGELRPDEVVVQTSRIGITKAIDTPWRFYIANNPYVSKSNSGLVYFTSLRVQ